MRSTFNNIFPLLMKDEGGFTNDKNDSGGPTNLGITLGDLPKGSTVEDIKNLTVSEAKSIYITKYWNALGCDGLSPGVDYTVFDYGVNSGVSRARASLNKHTTISGADLINAINNDRVAFLHRIGTGKNAGFLRGWLSRVNRVRAKSLSLSKPSALPATSVGFGIAVLAGSIAQFWHNYERLIIFVGIIAAISAGLLIYKHFNKGKQ